MAGTQGDPTWDKASGSTVRSAQSRPENQASSYPDPDPTPTRSTSRTSSTNGSRTVVGLMFFAVTFSLIGNEIKITNGATGPSAAPVTEGAKIILGGIIATALLTLLTHAGESGRELGVGLALVTAASSVLVFGGPVWQSANKLFGSTPTTPLGGTAASKPTNPTSGAGTAVAIAQAA